jgi:hypothetical protein
LCNQHFVSRAIVCGIWDTYGCEQCACLSPIFCAPKAIQPCRARFTELCCEFCTSGAQF